MRKRNQNGIGHETHEPLSPDLIHQALARVLTSAPFHTSKQSQNLLTYLVEKALTDQDEVLKERTIGIEVFGRVPDYHTADDPIVRSRAGEVRKRLAQYYQSEAARDCTVQITLQPFSYRPTFSLVSDPHAGGRNISGEEPSALASEYGQKEHEQDTGPPITQPSKRVPWYWWGIVAAVLCGFLGLSWMEFINSQRSELDLFWGPIFKSKKPVLIYSGTNSVYYPIHDFFPAPASGEDVSQGLNDILPPLGEGRQITAKDLEPNNTDYVQVGDISTNVNVAVLLASHHLAFDLRSGSGASFEDFHKSSTVLIGAFSNSWTLDMTGNLTFVFDRNHSIRERGGQNRTWSSVRTDGASEKDKVVEDYAIISRLLDSKTGGLMISIAGISTCGTRAAGEFVTDPLLLGKLKNLPRHAWESNNFQILLHSNFVKCVPTSTDIVALKYW